MKHNSGQQNLETILRSLCPEASDDDLRAAETNLKNYVRVMLSIYEQYLERQARGDVADASLTDRSEVDRIKQGETGSSH